MNDETANEQPDGAGVDPATEDEEATEANAPHQADRAPTADEESRADALTTEPSVAENFEEMNKLGADAKGEGRIP